MKTLVKNEFRQTRKTLLIWLGIMLLLCGFCYFELLSLRTVWMRWPGQSANFLA